MQKAPKGGKKLSDFPSIPANPKKTAGHTHTPRWEPSLSACAHAGKCTSEHPCFELRSVLTHCRDIHGGKQPPRYLRGQGPAPPGMRVGINTICEALPVPRWPQPLTGHVGWLCGSWGGGEQGAARGSCLCLSSQIST